MSKIGCSSPESGPQVLKLQKTAKKQLFLHSQTILDLNCGKLANLGSIS